jgi:hypothetical protein
MRMRDLARLDRASAGSGGASPSRRFRASVQFETLPQLSAANGGGNATSRSRHLTIRHPTALTVIAARSSIEDICFTEKTMCPASTKWWLLVLLVFGAVLFGSAR